MTTRLVSRRVFVPLAGVALAAIAVGIPTGGAYAATAKPATLDIWLVTASKHEPKSDKDRDKDKPDGGRSEKDKPDAGKDGGKDKDRDKDKLDGGGRVIPAELTAWGELNSEPLSEYAKFELLDHVTVPLPKDKPHKYTIKGETSSFEIAFVSAEPDPKAKNVLLYTYRVTFPSPDGKPESLVRITKQGERTIIRDRGFKHAHKAVRFVAMAVGP
jgi:hypothetical protein